MDYNNNNRQVVLTFLVVSLCVSFTYAGILFKNIDADWSFGFGRSGSGSGGHGYNTGFTWPISGHMMNSLPSPIRWIVEKLQGDRVWTNHWQ